MQENINLGAVQAPYWEQVLTLQPGETRKVDYVYDSFNLLQASIPEVLEVTFGGAATQTKFSAGMGYHLSAPVSYIQLFNTSDSPLTIDFSLAVGGITDNRLTVSGTVNTSTKLSAYSSVKAGSLTAPQSLEYEELFLAYTALLSANLAVFNLLPIPPLDGSKVLFSFLPQKYYGKLLQYERYRFLLLAVLLWIGVLDRPLTFLREGLIRLLWPICSWPVEQLLHFFH